MDSTERNTPGLISALTIGLALLLVGGLYYWNKSRTLTTANNRVEQRVDSLLATKIQLESDLRGVNRQLATVKDENSDLTRRVDAAYRQLNNKDVAMNELR